jgi:hypothetical protein
MQSLRVFSLKPRTLKSSIMRRPQRSNGPVLRVGKSSRAPLSSRRFAGPSMLAIGCPGSHALPITPRKMHDCDACSPPARAGSFLGSTTAVVRLGKCVSFTPASRPPAMSNQSSLQCQDPTVGVPPAERLNSTQTGHSCCPTASGAVAPLRTLDGVPGCR